MADYPLSITGAEIDSALGKVHSADTTPTNGSTDMVTSGGVYTAINNLSLANLAGSALVTESEGIASNDNDTTIPTSAAVKDYVDSSDPSTIYITNWRDESNSTTSSIEVYIPYGYRASRFQIKYAKSGTTISFTVEGNTFSSSQVTLTTLSTYTDLPQDTWLTLSSYTPTSNAGNKIVASGTGGGFGSPYFNIKSILVEATLIT